MRHTTFRVAAPAVLAALAAGSLLTGVPHAMTPASAVDPPQASTRVLVTNQDGAGCPDHQEVLIANPNTGDLDKSLGFPIGVGTTAANVGMLNEAKPFANNNNVVALWGGRSATVPGGIGVYDRTVVPPRWTTGFKLPAAFKTGEGQAHSVAALGDGHFAVALVGNYGAETQYGWVVILGPTGAVVDREPLTSAHGVEVAANGTTIYAIGHSEVRKYTYGLNGNHQLTYVAPAWPLPTEGGHDLRRRRSDSNYFVTTFTKAYVFNPGVAGSAAFTPAGGMTYDNANGGPLLGHIKAMDEGFDKKVVFNQYNSTQPAYFRFLNGHVEQATFCTKAYKMARWIWEPGQKVYPEDAGGGSLPPPPPPSSSSFQTTYTLAPDINPWWIEVTTGSDVSAVDVIADDGRIYMSLAKQSWGAWTGSPPSAIAQGDLVRFVARRSDGASAASTNFAWLVDQPDNVPGGWLTPFTLGPKNEWWIEVYVSSEAVKVEAKIGTGPFTALDKQAWGAWAKSLHAPLGSKVVIRAYRADGARAYSPIYTW